MDLTQLANLGEFIGGVAVLVTLVYLAVQVRQSQNQTQFLAEQISQGASATTANTMNSWLSAYGALVVEVTRDPEVARIYRSGLTDFDAMTGNDQMRFHAWMTTHILNAQTIYFQQEDGTMHREITEAVLGFNAAMLNTRGGRSWWHRGRTIWRPEFTEDMERRMDASPAIDSVWPWFLLDATDENPLQ